VQFSVLGGWSKKISLLRISVDFLVFERFEKKILIPVVFGKRRKRTPTWSTK